MKSSAIKKPGPVSVAAFVLLHALMIVKLPLRDILLFDALVLGVALPLVLADRRMAVLQKAGRNPAIWLTVALFYALAVLAGIGVYQFHRAGLF